MRAIGLILVMLGGLVLGYQGLNSAIKPNGVWRGPDVEQSDAIPSVPPVVSGIAVVSGLLLLASGRRSED